MHASPSRLRLSYPTRYDEYLVGYGDRGLWYPFAMVESYDERRAILPEEHGRVLELHHDTGLEYIDGRQTAGADLLTARASTESHSHLARYWVRQRHDLH